jgi:hypothetical protein
MAGVAFAVLVVFILGALFFTHRPDNRVPAGAGSLQNRTVSAPVNIPKVSKPARGSAEAPAVKATAAENFLDVDSAIAGIASPEKSSGPRQKAKEKKQAIVSKRSPSASAISPSARSPLQKPVDPRSNGKEPKDLTGTLKVNVEPYNAMVSIDGETISSQEIAMGRQFGAGEHVISVNAEGYVSYRQTLQMEPGTTQIMSIVLKQKERGSGFLNVYSYPWSTIFIDGLMLGTTPTPSPIALAEGEHIMRLERDGFVPYKETVTIKNGEVTRVQVDLVKQEPAETESPALDSTE